MNKKLGGKKIRKQLTTGQLERKLWLAFSEYVRLRDMDSEGYCICISCGRKVLAFGGQCHAGHYYPRVSVYKGIKYDEANVNAQCNFCNTFLEGNTQGYRKGLIEKYGHDILEYLENKRHEPLGWKKLDYVEKIEYYKKQVKELREIKHQCDLIEEEVKCQK